MHAAVIGRVVAWAVQHELRVRDLTASPLLGPAGNRDVLPPSLLRTGDGFDARMNAKRVPAPRRIGITFNPRLGARDLAYGLEASIRARGLQAWVEDEEAGPSDREAFVGSDLIICLGGDGTVLRCARLVTGMETVILGVNLGRLGFLTELDGFQVMQRLEDVLSGAGRVEERTMICASVPRTGDRIHGLNEAVIGRATLSRAIQLCSRRRRYAHRRLPLRRRNRCLRDRQHRVRALRRRADPPPGVSRPRHRPGSASSSGAPRTRAAGQRDRASYARAASAGRAQRRR